MKTDIPEIPDELLVRLRKSKARVAAAALAFLSGQRRAGTLSAASKLAGLTRDAFLRHLCRLIRDGRPNVIHGRLSQVHRRLLVWIMAAAIREGHPSAQVQLIFGYSWENLLRACQIHGVSLADRRPAGSSMGMRPKTLARFAGVDWQIRDTNLAKMSGVSREYIRQMRIKFKAGPSLGGRRTWPFPKPRLLNL